MSAEGLTKIVLSESLTAVVPHDGWSLMEENLLSHMKTYSYATKEVRSWCGNLSGLKVTTKARLRSRLQAIC